MPIDPTIALSAGQGVTQPTNPLQMAGQVQALSNAQATNRLLNTNADVAQQGLATAQQKAVAGIAVSSLSQIAGMDPQSPDYNTTLINSLHDGLTRAAQAGVIPQQQVQTYLDGIGRSLSAGHLVQAVRQTALQAIDPDAALTRIYGQNGTMTNGQFTQPGVFNNPFMGGGFASSGPSVRQMLTPAEKAQPVNRIGPDNQPGTVPLGTTVDPYGNPVGGGAAVPTTYPQSGQPAPGQQQPPGFVPTGMPPGQAEAMKNDVAAFQTDQQGISATGGANDRINGLQQARVALQAAMTGQGASGLQHMRQVMQTLGVLPAGLDPGTTDYATAKKYLLDYARKSAGATDQQLNAAIDSNASTDIPNPAAVHIVNTNIGRERMQIAATQTAPDQSGKGYLAYKQAYTSKYDPRAFAADLYDPVELKKMGDALNGTDRTKFMNGLAEAARLGLITSPQQAGPTAPQ